MLSKNLIILIIFLSAQNSFAQKISRILFVGNSLTYVNNLPALVKAEAASRGIEVFTESLALANYALEDHWNDGKLQLKIKTGDFDFVAVQQGPSSQMDGRQMLLTYGKRIQNLCYNYETKLAFFMVWPSRSNYRMFDGVIQNYTDAARITGSILCPVGQEWKAYFDATGDFGLYGSDDFHPSKKGSQKAAEIIVRSLFPE